MAPPLDPTQTAAHTYRLRPTAPAQTNQRPESAHGSSERTASAVPGRRQAPAVTLSLSPEALSLLNGEENRAGATRHDPYGSKGPVEPEIVARASAAATDDLFAPLDGAAPRGREAPFARLDLDGPRRPLPPPGSKLDITV